MRLPIPVEQLKSQLIGDGLITGEQFDVFFADAQNKNQSIIDVLVAQKVVSSTYITNLIAGLLGVEKANLVNYQLRSEIVSLLPEEIARQRETIVFEREPSGILDVAMTDPSDLETIEFLGQRLGAKIRPFLASEEDLNRGYAVYGFKLGQDFKKLIEENIQATLAGQVGSAEEAASQVPVVAIVNNILSYAISSRASDIHIEILDDSTLIRYRIDGILYEIMRVPKTIHSALVARLKLLAGLKIDEHYRPQDGRFRYQIVNQIIDVRVAVMPTYYGEKVEMRLLEASQKPLSLEELGFLSRDAAVITESLKKAYGMIISCGPTGSGKTTTLYGFMNILNKTQVNVVTIEDPIEYNMRYANQTQVNAQAGITFANALRAFLRQDPNIIMVGEIRDAETAGIAVQAALTGHLIVSSLHTNDAPTAVPRMFDLEIPPFLVASVLNLLVAQRLVRKICQTCLSSFEADETMLQAIQEQLKDLHLTDTKVRMPKILYKGGGCNSCSMTGYRGRMGIFEVLKVTDTIKEVIMNPKFSLEELALAARKDGMRTMFEDGLEKAQLGMTTIDEVLRVIRE